MSENFGVYLKRMREQRGLTLAQLSEESDISIAQLSRLENSLRDEPRQETITKLAGALNVPYVEVMIAAGYLDNMSKDELDDFKAASTQRDLIKKTIKNPDPLANEKEFLNNLELSDEELIKKFNPKIDGQSLSQEEYRDMIAYIRVKRQMNANSSES